jgi:hypothetical protein
MRVRSETSSPKPPKASAMVLRPTVLTDGEVSLNEGVELGVEKEDVLLPIAEKLTLDSEPNDQCRGTRL